MFLKKLDKKEKNVGLSQLMLSSLYLTKILKFFLLRNCSTPNNLCVLYNSDHYHLNQELPSRPNVLLGYRA